MNRNKLYSIQMDIFKRTVITLSSAVLAFLQPVQNAVHLLVFLFLANLLVGIFHDIFINKNAFIFKKFIWASFEFLVYVGIVCGIYIISFFQDGISEGQFIIKMISYVYVYAYATNIFKNLILVRPRNFVFKFIYYVLSLAFIKRIPYLADFINYEKEKEEDEN